MKKKICILGGGTSGWMTAAFLSKYFNNDVEISIVYNHQDPVIGVGESTTPTFVNFCKFIDISVGEMIKELGATIKLGIKFDNWNGDNKYFFHNFNCLQDIPRMITGHNLIASYGISEKDDYDAESYQQIFTETNILPIDPTYEILSPHAMHIDAVNFSKLIKKKFEHKVAVYDDIIVDIKTNENGIESLQGEHNLYKADIYIDSSGLQSKLISMFDNHWIDKSNQLPMDSAFFFKIPHNNKNIPNFTDAIATSNGWIWKIPLKDRYGCGYVFSSKFTDIDDARNRFKFFLKEKHNIDAELNRCINFKTGYYESQWNKNIVSIGLSSGFAEPLESTSIHMIINQIFTFSKTWKFNNNNWNRQIYNNLMSNMYEQCFKFIRLHYDTKRNDSKLWIYLNENKEQWLLDYNEKCQTGMIDQFDIFYNWDRDLSTNIFAVEAWTRVTTGLGKIDKDIIQKYLQDIGMHDLAKQSYDHLQFARNDLLKKAMHHDEFLKIFQN